MRLFISSMVRKLKFQPTKKIKQKGRLSSYKDVLICLFVYVNFISLKLNRILTLLFIFFCPFAYPKQGQVDSLKSLLSISLKNVSVHDTLTVKRLNQLASQYFSSNPDSTLFFGSKAVKLSRSLNYKPGLADGLVQTAHANFFKGRYSLATKDFNEAIGIYKSVNNKSGLSYCYMLYGKMYTLLADYKQSLIYLNMALAIDKELGNNKTLADCLKNIGILYFSEGQLSTALDYYYCALSINLKINNRRASAEVYNDIGFTLYGMEMYPKALEYYKKALGMFERSHDVFGIGTVNENIGETLLAQKQYDSAIPYLNKSMAVAETQDDKDGMSSVYTDMGLCYAYKHEYAKALKYLNTSLSIARKFKIVGNEAGTLIGMATFYNMQKDYKNAYKYATEGQALSLKIGNLATRSAAAFELNKTLAGLGQFNEAYKLLKQYIALKDSLNNNESIQKLTSYNLEIKFENRQRQLAVLQKEKDILLNQQIKQQRLINAIFFIMMMSTLTVSFIYYRQKRKQQKINKLLADRNREVHLQKTNLDDQSKKLNDLNVLKDRLISILAHDLRAPLSTLRGLFSLLEDDTITHEQLLSMIPGVLKKLEYTSDFLDTLLFWINSQMENFENSSKNFNVKDIVAFETESYHEQAAFKGIRLIDNVSSNIIVSADPNSIRIVLRNLITNAIKFSGRNDIIEITSEQQDSKNHVITVKDSGTGMSEEQLSKLFKTKVNSKSGTHNESGTGMGMLFCKDLIEKCSGKIWVNSKQGEGTSFSFTIPAASENELQLA